MRADGDTELLVTLENGDGSTTVAKQIIPVPAGDWRKVDLSLIANGNESHGRFSIRLRKPGTATIGYVFLQPGEWGRFKNLPVRRDVAEGLITQGVTIIRYGGSMVNNAEYRWKKMIGPFEHRQPYNGHWYPFSTNGWGVIDFLNLCDAANVVAVPDLNVDESPADMADFVEYVNGPATSTWGKRRADDGHPSPYKLKYLELGNEETVNAEYAQKFNALAEAIWAKDPDIVLVVGDFSYRDKITDPDKITNADGKITSMEGHRQILDFARAHDREVWFDVHVWSEDVKNHANLTALPSYIDAIDKLAGDVKHKVVVFELNANTHSQSRALANAISINTIRRDNRILVVISANALQPDGQNSNGWNQGLLFLNQSATWLQPPGYLTQMQANNEQPVLLNCDVPRTENRKLDVTVTRDEANKTLILQIINPGEATTANIELIGFTPTKSSAAITELAARESAANTARNPTAVHPEQSTWNYQLTNGKISREFPAHSFTIIRFE